jgi:hypothetical protein
MQAQIPLSWNDPAFAKVVTSKAITIESGGMRENLSITENGPSASVQGGDFTLRNSRIRSAEAIRVWGGGTVTIDGVWAEAVGQPGDHADVLQCYAPHSRSDITVRNTTFRAYNDYATAGYFSADYFEGTHTFENVLFWGGPYGLRIHADGGDVSVSLKNVYFVGPFAWGPFLLLNNYGTTTKILKWENVRWATIENGQLVPGVEIPRPF